jgi:metallo-beta-lactamase family protein
LAVEASEIFRKYPEYLDEETNRFIRAFKHPALDFPGLTYVKSVEESKSLNNRHEPMVIISASGMAETGRILHHLKNNVENPRNTILIVGWQAPDTLGRRLVEGAKELRIFGQLYECRAQVENINGLSAHAGQQLLLKYAESVKGRIKKLFLVHGEEDAATVFMQKLKEHGIGPFEYPDLGESVEL